MENYDGMLFARIVGYLDMRKGIRDVCVVTTMS